MATITTTITPEGQRNQWNVPEGYQSHGIPRGEIVFTGSFTVAAIGAGDVGVINISFEPPAQYYYKVAELSVLVTATSEADLDDLDTAIFGQYLNFRTGGVNAQTKSFQLVNFSHVGAQSSGTAGLQMNSVTSGTPFGATYTFPPGEDLSGMILSTVGGVGSIFLNLENPVASSDGLWLVFPYCRMLQYDVSDEFEYLLHTPVPVLPA